MRLSFTDTSERDRNFRRILRMPRPVGLLTLLALLVSSAAFAQDVAPPPPDGMFAIEGEAGDDPRLLLAEAQEAEVIKAAGPQIQLTATGPGWVYSPFPLYVVTGSTRPWRMVLNAGPMTHDDGTAQIALTDVEARDGLTPTPWTTVDGTPMWQNLSGNPEQYLQLEFRVNVRYDHTPGHYVSHMTLNWVMPPAAGLPGATGTIPMELHLDVPQLIGAELLDDTITIPTQSSDVGWARSEDDVTLNVYSNGPFDLRIDTCPDLTLEETVMPTAMRLRQTAGAGPPFDVWGDLGGSSHGQAEQPWAVPQSADSPWPGSVVTGAGAPGTTSVGISAAAWRNGYQDPYGQYGTSVVITVSLP